MPDEGFQAGTVAKRRSRCDMLRLLQFVQQFPISRWRRLGNDQAMVVWLIVLTAYVALGLQLLAAWVWIRFQRIVFADNAVRTVTSRPGKQQSSGRAATN
ncbi:MAG TPA: hypothetical protein VFV93_14435 [Thermomicrobiales bacterium]|nr:hypothetical protein [Thermomicrobiales bacterium]